LTCHPNQKGPSRKNKAFVKSGLTPTEKRIVATTLAEARERWKALFALNKWRAPEK
jgi:5-bromo-4-chloroindolyl phosphate hydrolysis protein